MLVTEGEKGHEMDGWDGVSSDEGVLRDHRREILTYHPPEV